MVTSATMSIENHIIEKAMKDKSFRSSLMANPKDTLEKYLNIEFPPHLQIRVMEEKSDTMYFILPSFPENNHQETVDLGLDEINTGASETHTSCCRCSVTAPKTKGAGCGDYT